MYINRSRRLWPVCLAFTAGILLAACGAETAPDTSTAPQPAEAAAAGVNFGGGNYAFLAADEMPPDAAEVTLTLVEGVDGNAVRIEPEGDGVPYIVIDAGSLLGDAVSRLYEMQVTVEVENPCGEFHAVSGELLAYSGAERAESADSWSVYLSDKNPNIARALLDSEAQRFVPGAHNFFVLTRKVDNAVAEGHPPANLILRGIRFLAEDGSELPVNPDAVFDAPAGFGEPDRTNLLAVSGEVALEDAAGSSSDWGQAIALPTIKNDGGVLDPALLTPGCVITVHYTAATPPELILQSWTDGAPDTAGWAKVAPAAVNNTGTTAQFVYADLVAAFGGEDFAAYLDQLYVGDTGSALRLHAVTVGRAD